MVRLNYILIINLSLVSLLMINIITLTKQYPVLKNLFSLQLIALLNNYFSLGVGIALPLIGLASILSWVQLMLLVSGKIPPHLKQEGLMTVILTLAKHL